MSIESLKEQARRHEQKEEWPKALDQYKKAITLLERDDQTDIGLYNRVGDLFVRVTSLDEAVENYEKAVDLYVEEGLQNNAIAVCKKIIRNVPRRHQVYLRMGQIRAEQGFIPDARTNFLLYAERMQQEGDLDESFRALVEFCDLAPAETDLRLAVADQMASHQRVAEAVAQMTVAYHALRAAGDDDRVAEVEARILETDPEADLTVVDEAAVVGAEPVEDAFEMGAGLDKASAAEATHDAMEGLESTSLLPAEAEPEAAPGDVDGADEPEDVSADPLGEAAEGEVPVGEAPGAAADAEEVFVTTPAEEPGRFEGGEAQPGEPAWDQRDDVDDTEEVVVDLPFIEVAFDADEDELAVTSPPALDLEGEVAFDGDEDELAVTSPPALDLEGDGADDLFELPLLDVVADDDVAADDSGWALEEALEEAAADAEDELAPEPVVDVAEGYLEPGPIADDTDGDAAAAPIPTPQLDWKQAKARIEEDPADVDLRQRMVELAYQSGETSALVEAFMGLGGALDLAGDEVRARVAYHQVLNLDQDHAGARAALGGDAPVAQAPVKEVAANEDYVDLGSLILGEETEKTTRFVVEYEEPSGDEEADFAKMLSQFKEKVSQNLDADDVRAHHDLGTAYKEMGLLNEAVAEFQQALRGSGSHLPTYEMLGQTFIEMNNPAAAVRSLERALEVDFAVEDELLAIYYYLGRAYEQVGSRDQAVEFYDRVFSLDINFADVTERLRALR